jgi:hypothetical protein
MTLPRSHHHGNVVGTSVHQHSARIRKPKPKYSTVDAFTDKSQIRLNLVVRLQAVETVLIVCTVLQQFNFVPIDPDTGFQLLSDRASRQ